MEVGVVGSEGVEWGVGVRVTWGEGRGWQAFDPLTAGADVIEGVERRGHHEKKGLPRGELFSRASQR